MLQSLSEICSCRICCCTVIMLNVYIFSTLWNSNWHLTSVTSWPAFSDLCKTHLTHRCKAFHYHSWLHVWCMAFILLYGIAVCIFGLEQGPYMCGIPRVMCSESCVSQCIFIRLLYRRLDIRHIYCHPWQPMQSLMGLGWKCRQAEAHRYCSVFSSQFFRAETMFFPQTTWDLHSLLHCSAWNVMFRCSHR